YKGELMPLLLKVMDERGDNNIRNSAARTYAHWAGKEEAATLGKMLNDGSKEVQNAALDALVRLKDDRAVPAMAARLSDFFQRENAVAFLRNYGKGAEKEVLKYAFDSDDGVRNEAQKLLKGYGTPDAALFDQALVELKGDAKRKRAAALWLAGAQVNE